MKEHKIESLPMWAQKRIKDREWEIAQLEKRLNDAEKANQICNEMDWFTLGVHTTESRGLFLIDKDKPHQICSIGEGAILLVGHKRKASDGIRD